MRAKVQWATNDPDLEEGKKKELLEALDVLQTLQNELYEQEVVNSGLSGRIGTMNA